LTFVEKPEHFIGGTRWTETDSRGELTIKAIGMSRYCRVQLGTVSDCERSISITTPVVVELLSITGLQSVNRDVMQLNIVTG